MNQGSGNGETAAPGAHQALNELFSAMYEELRRLAYTIKRSDSSATLNPTALVNEAWLKLASSPLFASTSQLHFKRIAARAMRQVLVEAARRRGASKRGGDGGTIFVTFDEALHQPASSSDDFLALENALSELEGLEPRLALLVESRFFGGLDVAETAALLDLSEATVQRDWRSAKAWLSHRLRSAE